MQEVNEENLMSWINEELHSQQIQMSEEDKNILVNEALGIYENQILTLEPIHEAINIMTGLTMEKIKAFKASTAQTFD